MTYIAKQADSRGVVHYTEEENHTWEILIKRQLNIVENRACRDFMDGLERLALPLNHVPQIPQINQTLEHYTGWNVVPVSAVIPLTTFFTLLSERKFPAATFIRTQEELDFLKEPDIFHEYFGHCPLLTHQAYADFMYWYGTTALKADKKTRQLLGRLFWFTIEFGLIAENNALKIYGGGLLSSKEETIYALESPIPKRLAFNIEQALRTPYRYDEIQTLYYSIQSMDDLYHIMDSDILQLAHHALSQGDIEPGFVIC